MSSINFYHLIISFNYYVNSKLVCVIISKSITLYHILHIILLNDTISLCIILTIDYSLIKVKSCQNICRKINFVIDMKKCVDITWTTGSARGGVGISDRKFCKSLSCILLFAVVVAVVTGVDGAGVLVDDLLLPRLLWH